MVTKNKFFTFPARLTALAPGLHTDSTKLSVPGWDQTYNALVSTLLSQRISSLCQPGMVSKESKYSNKSLRSISVK